MDSGGSMHSNEDKGAEKSMDDYLKSIGLHRKKIAKDGSCLFRAVAEQVLHSQSLHTKVRAECVEFLKENRERYEAFIEGDFEDYLLKLQDPQQWVGEVEINALAVMYKRDFLIFQEPGKAAVNITDKDFKDQVRLCFLNGNHYDSVYPVSHIKNGALCQSILYELLYDGVFKVDRSSLGSCQRIGRPSDLLSDDNMNACVSSDESDLDASDALWVENETSATASRHNSYRGRGRGRHLPERVRRSLNPTLFRNVEFDVWHKTKKAQQKMDYNIAAGMQFAVGDRCQVRLDGSGRSYSATVREVSANNGPVSVYLDELGTRKQVPLWSLRPPSDGTSWSTVVNRDKKLSNGHGEWESRGRGRGKHLPASPSSSVPSATPPGSSGQVPKQHTWPMQATAEEQVSRKLVSSVESAFGLTEEQRLVREEEKRNVALVEIQLRDELSFPALGSDGGRRKGGEKKRNQRNKMSPVEDVRTPSPSAGERPKSSTPPPASSPTAATSTATPRAPAATPADSNKPSWLSSIKASAPNVNMAATAAKSNSYASAVTPPSPPSSIKAPDSPLPSIPSSATLLLTPALPSASSPPAPKPASSPPPSSSLPPPTFIAPIAPSPAAAQGFLPASSLPRSSTPPSSSSPLVHPAAPPASAQSSPLNTGGSQTSQNQAPLPQNQTSQNQTPLPQVSLPQNQTPMSQNQAPLPQNQTSQNQTSQNQAPLPQNQTPLPQVSLPQNQTPMSQNQSPLPQNQTTQNQAPLPQTQVSLPQNQNLMSQNQTPLPQNQTTQNQAPLPQIQTPQNQASLPQNQTSQSQATLPQNQASLPQNQTSLHQNQAPMSQNQVPLPQNHPQVSLSRASASPVPLTQIENQTQSSLIPTSQSFPPPMQHQSQTQSEAVHPSLSPSTSQAEALAVQPAPPPHHPLLHQSIPVPLQQLSQLYQDPLYPGFPQDEKGNVAPTPPFCSSQSGDDLPQNLNILKFFFNLGVKAYSMPMFPPYLYLLPLQQAHTMHPKLPSRSPSPTPHYPPPRHQEAYAPPQYPPTSASVPPQYDHQALLAEPPRPVDPSFSQAGYPVAQPPPHRMPWQQQQHPPPRNPGYSVGYPSPAPSYRAPPHLSQQGYHPGQGQGHPLYTQYPPSSLGYQSSPTPEELQVSQGPMEQRKPTNGEAMPGQGAGRVPGPLESLAAANVANANRPAVAPNYAHIEQGDTSSRAVLLVDPPLNNTPIIKVVLNPEAKDVSMTTMKPNSSIGSPLPYDVISKVVVPGDNPSHGYRGHRKALHPANSGYAPLLPPEPGHMGYLAAVATDSLSVGCSTEDDWDEAAGFKPTTSNYRGQRRNQRGGGRGRGGFDPGRGGNRRRHGGEPGAGLNYIQFSSTHRGRGWERGY